MQFAEKGLHKGMSSLGDLASKGREHLFSNLGHLDLEFSVGGIFGGIGFRVCRIDFSIMESGPDLTSKEKGPADTDSTDGIQLIRIKKDFRLCCFRRGTASETMGINAMADCFPVCLGIAIIYGEAVPPFSLPARHGRSYLDCCFPVCVRYHGAA